METFQYNEEAFLSRFKIVSGRIHHEQLPDLIQSLLKEKSIRDLSGQLNLGWTKSRERGSDTVVQIIAGGQTNLKYNDFLNLLLYKRGLTRTPFSGKLPIYKNKDSNVIAQKAPSAIALMLAKRLLAGEPESLNKRMRLCALILNTSLSALCRSVNGNLSRNIHTNKLSLKLGDIFCRIYNINPYWLAGGLGSIFPYTPIPTNLPFRSPFSRILHPYKLYPRNFDKHRDTKDKVHQLLLKYGENVLAQRTGIRRCLVTKWKHTKWFRKETTAIINAAFMGDFPNPPKPEVHPSKELLGRVLHKFGRFELEKALHIYPCQMDILLNQQRLLPTTIQKLQLLLDGGTLPEKEKRKVKKEPNVTSSAQQAQQAYEAQTAEVFARVIARVQGQH